MFCPIKCGSTDQFVYPNLQNQLNHIRTGPVCLQWQALSIMHGYIYIYSIIIITIIINYCYSIIIIYMYNIRIYIYYDILFNMF